MQGCREWGNPLYRAVRVCAEMGGKQHRRGGEVRSGAGGGKQSGQQFGTLKPGGRQVYPAVGQFFGVANDEDGCGRLRFRRGDDLGVNLQGAEQQQEEKGSHAAEPLSEGCHGARIAPVCSVGMKLSPWLSMTAYRYLESL
jgi:hypothetical protein